MPFKIVQTHLKQTGNRRVLRPDSHVVVGILGRNETENAPLLQKGKYH